MNRKNHWKKLAALALCAVLLLSGCGGKAGGSSSQKADASSSNDSSDSSSGASARDYSKYNSYMELYGELSDMEDILLEYFMNVDYTEDFALLEGGDYGAMKENVQYYTGHAYIARDALEYVDEEPSYPKVDAAVRALGESPEQMMDALEALASYMLFDDFQKDNLARAPEIHAGIWEALQVFDPYYGEMMDAMDELAAELRDEDMEDMLNDGQLILYHSRIMIHNSEDILGDIWDQLEVSFENMDPEDDFVLPEIDTANIMPMFDQVNAAYEELTAALADEEQQAKVFTGPAADVSIQMYTRTVDALHARMGELANVLKDGLDYSDAYDSASDALSSMIDGYNGLI